LIKINHFSKFSRTQFFVQINLLVAIIFTLKMTMWSGSISNAAHAFKIQYPYQ
jgi:hypothetical protein